MAHVNCLSLVTTPRRYYYCTTLRVRNRSTEKERKYLRFIGIWAPKPCSEGPRRTGLADVVKEMVIAQEWV